MGDQKSIKEVFLQKAQETSASEEEKATPVQEVKKDEKDKKIAIENNFGANKGYLTAFESFIKKDKSPKGKNLLQSPPKDKNKESEKSKVEKSFVLLASTLHPKKIVREEMNKEKRKAEEKRKKEEEQKRVTDDEKRGTKRKE